MLSQIAEHGLGVLPELIRTVINGAMQLEWQNHLGIGPCERSPERRHDAGGYKPETVVMRVRRINFEVPQTHGGNFHPGSLEKGLRSERA